MKLHTSLGRLRNGLWTIYQTTLNRTRKADTLVGTHLGATIICGTRSLIGVTGI